MCGGGGGGGGHSLSMREISVWDIKVYKIQKVANKKHSHIITDFFFFQGLFKVSHAAMIIIPLVL